MLSSLLGKIFNEDDTSPPISPRSDSPEFDYSLINSGDPEGFIDKAESEDIIDIFSSYRESLKKDTDADEPTLMSNAELRTKLYEAPTGTHSSELTTHSSELTTHSSESIIDIKIRSIKENYNDDPKLYIKLINYLNIDLDKTKIPNSYMNLTGISYQIYNRHLIIFIPIYLSPPKWQPYTDSPIYFNMLKDHLRTTTTEFYITKMPYLATINSNEIYCSNHTTYGWLKISQNDLIFFYGGLSNYFSE